MRFNNYRTCACIIGSRVKRTCICIRVWKFASGQVYLYRCIYMKAGRGRWYRSRLFPNDFLFACSLNWKNGPPLPLLFLDYKRKQAIHFQVYNIEVDLALSVGLHDIVRLILILYCLASIFKTVVNTTFIYSFRYNIEIVVLVM